MIYGAEMTRRQSSVVEKALKELRRTKAKVYRIAAKYGVAPSTLYRAQRTKDAE